MKPHEVAELTIPQVFAYMKRGAVQDPFGIGVALGSNMPSGRPDHAATMEQEDNTEEFSQKCRKYALAHGGKKGKPFSMTWDDLDKWEK